MVFFVYSFALQLISLLGLPLIALHLWRSPKHRAGLKQRLGLYSEPLKQQLVRQANLWVHCVSVGEFLAAEPLIRRLKADWPPFQLVVTTTTRTGQNLAQKRLKDIAQVLYVPLDFPFALRSFYQIVSPRLTLIMETEIWPSLLHLSPCPVILMNARLSDGSFQNYRKGRWFLRPFLKKLTIILVQTSRDKERFEALGVCAEQVLALGHFKYEAALARKEQQKPVYSVKNKEEASVRILLAASTHAGEDEVMLAAFENLNNQMDEKWRLILAPRHPERCPEVEYLLAQTSLSWAYLSDCQQSGAEIWSKDVCLVDTIGDLFDLYALADMVVMGGSWVKHGGQNPLEAAVWSRAIICGPYMFNFTDIVEDLLRHHAVEQLASREDLKGAVLRLAQNELTRETLGQNAWACVSRDKHVIDQALDVIRRTLPH